MKRPLPPSASVAETLGGGKLHAPAAARNTEALIDVLQRHAPQSGRALELASGTGQHVTAFAAALPGLIWQPSDIDASRRASVDAHVQDAGLGNVRPALPLDAGQPGWSTDHPGQDLILLVNLLHLVTEEQTRVLIGEAARTLAANGVLILYGPFRRGGALTSAGDRRFDADLRATDPQIGYKDDTLIAALLSDAGLSPIDLVEMPANNLTFIARKPGA